MTRLRSLLVKLAIAFLSLLVTLLLLEGALRLVAPNPKPGEIDEVRYDLLIEFDPLLGWRKIPNYTVRNEATEYLVLEAINAQGLRGPEIPYEKPPGEYRILVVGDSFVEGYYLEFEQLFTEVMAADLAGVRPLEVIAAGTRGYSTDQEYLYFQTEGVKFSPDLTILMFYFNDVWNNLQLKEYGIEKPLFEMNEDGELSLTNIPIADPTPEKSQAPLARSLREMRNLRKWFAENSYLYHFLAPRVSELSFALRLRTKTARPAPGPSEGEEPPGLPAGWQDEILLYQTPEGEQAARAWELTEALLVQFEAEVRASGSDFLIVLIPRRESVYLDSWQEALARYNLPEEEWNVEQVRDRFIALCGRNGFDCLDLTEPLRAEAVRLHPQGRLLYYLEDPHWNVDGNAFVGHFLAEFLAQYWLPSP